MADLVWLDAAEVWFPPIDTAQIEPNGLLAVGGDLSPQRLLLAYKSGIFPWFEEGQPILWWSPSPRAVIVPAQFKPGRSLMKHLRKDAFEVRVNQNFRGVIDACAAQRRDTGGTWITREISAAYIQLHHDGVAHCFESYQNDKLVGGLYGLCIGHLFFGESMFHTVTDASKVAFAYLCRLMHQHQCPLIDCQVANPHLISLGCTLMGRKRFQRYLQVFTHPEDSIDWTSIAGTLPDWRSLDRAL